MFNKQRRNDLQDHIRSPFKMSLKIKNYREKIYKHEKISVKNYYKNETIFPVFIENLSNLENYS
jgi:hypothetical protein